MKKTKNQGITIIALVITIIILLILAGVAIATLTGENGILSKAKTAKTDMTQATAKEKVQVAVLGSYGTEGKLNNEELKTNLDKVEGIKEVPEKIRDEDFPITVEVDGYEVTITKEGNVTIKNSTTNNPQEPDDSKGDENNNNLLNRIDSLEKEIKVLKTQTFNYEEKYLWTSTTLNSGTTSKVYTVEEDGIYYVEVFAIIENGSNQSEMQCLINYNNVQIAGNYDRPNVTYPTVSCNSIIDAKKGETILGYLYSSRTIGVDDRATIRIKVVKLR